MGEMGPKSRQVVDYFSSVSGTAMATTMNPADYAMSAVSTLDPDGAQALFRKSKQHEDLIETLREENELPPEQNQAAIGLMSTTKEGAASSRSFWRELGILTRRMVVTQWRNPAYSVTRIVCSLCLSIYFGILFGKDKSTIEGAVLTIGSTFFLVFVLVVPMQASVVPLVEDRAVLYREATSGLYSRWTYSIASSLADIPFHVLNCLVMFCGFYFIVGFQLTDDRPAYFIAMIFLVNWAFTSIGEVYAVVTPNEEAANGMAGLTTILSVLFMGFLIRIDEMPSFWQWANWSDLLRYVIQGLTSNELGDSRYLLFDPDDIHGPWGNENATIFGNLGDNATNMFLVPQGTDVSPGSDASQASVILNLLFAARPSLNQDWNASILGTLIAFVDGGMANECFTEPVATNFMRCFVIGIRPPCSDEFEALAESYANGADNVRECLSLGNGNTTLSLPGNSSLLPLTFGNRTNAVETADFLALPEDDRREMIICLLNAILPAGALKTKSKSSSRRSSRSCRVFQ